MWVFPLLMTRTKHNLHNSKVKTLRLSQKRCKKRQIHEREVCASLTEPLIQTNHIGMLSILSGNPGYDALLGNRKPLIHYVFGIVLRTNMLQSIVWMLQKHVLHWVVTNVHLVTRTHKNNEWSIWPLHRLHKWRLVLFKNTKHGYLLQWCYGSPWNIL